MFKSRLKFFRELYSITQEEITEKCGVSLATVKRYEAGGTLPDISFLEEMQKHFGVSPVWLVSGTGEIIYRQDFKERDRLLKVINSLDSLDLQILEELQKRSPSEKERLLAGLRKKDF